MFLRPSFILIVPIAVLAGCANFNSIHRPLDLSGGKGVLVDAKQRGILVGERLEKNAAGVSGQRVICPEPSPDALAAYAAEIAATSEQVGLQVATAFQESAASIGVRTSSIQLLRDQISYNCIDFMNGATTSDQHDVRARRSQKHTVALLAIEQLTGAVRAPSVVINTLGGAEASRSLKEMSDQIAEIDARLADLAKSKEGQTTAEEKAAAQSETNRLKEIRASTLEAIKGARGQMASGSATASLNMTGIPASPTVPQEKAVDAVKEIARDIINSDDTPQLCLTSLARTGKTDDQFGTFCLTLLTSGNEARALKLRVEQAWYDSALKISDANRRTEELRKIRDSLTSDNFVAAAKAMAIPFKIDLKQP